MKSRDMKTNNSGAKITSGLLWTYGERITAQGISLIVSIILARLLSPEEYGIISIVMIFITICDAFVVGGFGNALIQKKDADDIDFSTMFYCGLILSVFLYCVLFVCSPSIAAFYDKEILVPVIRVLAIRIPVSGINSIQQARIQKKMDFKKFFFATLGGTIVSAVIGISMAYQGFGVWALVAQYLSNIIIDTIVLFLLERWHPRLIFSFERAKNLLAFGWKVLVSTIVFTIEGDFRSLVVGKMFGSAELAYYDQGKKFPNVIVSNINTSISKVMFPALSLQQEDKERLKNMCRRSVKTGVFLLAPFLIGLMACADDFVSVILTDKWTPCVPFLRILSIVFLVRPLTTTSQQAILAIGRSDITLKIQIIINGIAVSLLAVFAFCFKSLILVAWSSVITEAVALVMFMYYEKQLIQYSLHEQFWDLLPSLFLSLGIGLIVYGIHFIPVTPMIRLVTQVIIGSSAYFILSVLLKMEPLKYLLNMLMGKIHMRFLEKLVNMM